MLRVYTYCSYKGSYNGYQYAFWDTADGRKEGYVESVLSQEGTEKWPPEFSYVKGMLEHSKGWKILLKKAGEAEGILLVSKVEKAAEIEKAKRKDAYEEQRIRNQFAGCADAVKQGRLNEAESQFFINVAVAGEWSRVKKLAAHCVWDLMDRESQGLGLMHDMERILGKSSDRERYYLKIEEWRQFEEKVKGSVQRMKEGLESNIPVQESLPGFRGFVSRHMGLQKISPYVRLDKEEGMVPGLDERRKKVQEQVIGKLLRKTDFSQEYVLVVTDEGSLDKTGFEELRKAEKANMIFDIGYIKE